MKAPMKNLSRYLVVVLSVAAVNAWGFPKIVDETALKPSVDPCEDFYQFACGTWIDQTAIPSDRGYVSRQVSPMMDAVDIKLNQILEAYSRGDFTVPSTYSQKLADYYKSCMNADQTSVEAMAKVRSISKQIGAVQSPQDLARLMASFKLWGLNGFFSLYSIQDFNDSSVVLADIGQGGMGLSNPAYYLDQDKKSAEIRQKYKEHIAKLFELMGVHGFKARHIAGRILKMETFLAKKAYSVADQNDPEKINHPVGLDGLQKLAPHFDWSVFWTEMGLKSTALNVETPEFFQNLDVFLTKVSKKDLQYYLTWQLLNRSADEMGGAFEKAHFDFWSSYMRGVKAMKPRWKLCTEEVEGSLGYALAEAYVNVIDGKAIKAKTESMIEKIKEAFVEDLGVLTRGLGAWIDEATFQQAVEKVNLIAQKVGAPQEFRNYDALQVSGNYLENSMNINEFEVRRDLAKIGQPVDKSEWGMMPWEVNAYYDRSNNEFVFPFGILQPPSLDLTASDGANYGSFGGGTIGHELTHGFDNNGAKYDSHGNLKNWWTAETEARFEEKSKCFADQASLYRIESVGLNVNGPQTLEENLADQGGVKLGYVALDRILKSRPEAPKWLGQYSERQQFWIAYAQSWCSKETNESLRSQMTNDEHPPAEFRVNAVMMNRPEFARDFSCSANKKMAPTNRCTLW